MFLMNFKEDHPRDVPIVIIHNTTQNNVVISSTLTRLSGTKQLGNLLYPVSKK